MREELVRNFSRTWGYVQGKHWLVRIEMSLAEETSAVRRPLSRYRDVPAWPADVRPAPSPNRQDLSLLHSLLTRTEHGLTPKVNPSKVAAAEKATATCPPRASESQGSQRQCRGRDGVCISLKD
jgi:hypothetical protein